MTHGLDERVADRRIVELARWWQEATNEARFNLLQRSSRKEEGAPDHTQLLAAIILVESYAGEAIGEG